jgi:exoribonuclease R
LPLHVADPPVPRPGRAPGAAARAGAGRRPGAGGPPCARGAHREAAQVEYLADELCLAWLLERRLFELGWEERWEGEIVGLIGSGLFVRFGTVFEGFLPARRLHGEFFELSPLGTALVGRTTGRGYRLGDGIRVRVESIARNEGKVELALA